MSETSTIVCRRSPLPVRLPRLSPDGFFHLVLSGLALGFVLVSTVGFRVAGGTMLPGPLALRAVLPTLFLGAIAFYQWRRERRIVGLLTIVFWSLTFGLLYLPPMYLAARCPGPYRDDVLAGLDRVLGIEVPDVLRGIDVFPTVKRFLGCCYDTLLLFLTAAIMLPPLCGQMRRAKEYLIAGIASAILSIPIFAALPARGPWHHYGYTATPEQEKVAQVITALKNEDAFVMNLCRTEGIITFPSFHTVLALLATFALWPVPYARWPAVLLAGLILLSTITTGWHYLCDVLAGFLIAIISCTVARGYSWLEDWLAVKEEG